MKNKKGFTLVELLAVIVILAVILIIAIPQITRTIEGMRIKSIEDSARLIASNAEKHYFAHKAASESYNETNIPCTDITKLSKDYASCSIIYDEDGNATVKLKGASGGKFNRIECIGTKDNVSCTKREWVYAFGNITNASDGEENFRNLKDDSNNERPVFIRYNKNNLSEKYVCTTYNMTNNEPTCISENAYATRDDIDAEWNTIKALFGENNCHTLSNWADCAIRGSISFSWFCENGVDGRITCGYKENDLVSSCFININNASPNCGVHVDSGGK